MNASMSAGGDHEAKFTPEWREPFSDGRSPLVAAEQTGRRCYTMEKSPPFVTTDRLIELSQKAYEEGKKYASRTTRAAAAALQRRKGIAI